MDAYEIGLGARTSWERGFFVDDRHDTKGHRVFLRAWLSFVLVAIIAVTGRSHLVQLKRPPFAQTAVTLSAASPVPTSALAVASTPQDGSTGIAATVGLPIQVGSTVVVKNKNVPLRSAPSTSATIIAALAQGTTLTVIGPAEDAESFTWWPVHDPATGLTGFVQQVYLTPLEDLDDPWVLARLLINNPFQPGELPFGFVPDDPEPVTWKGLESGAFPSSLGETELIGVEAAPNNEILWAIFSSATDAEYGLAVLEAALKRVGYEVSDQPGFDRALLFRADIKGWPVAACVVQRDNVLILGVSGALNESQDLVTNAVDLAAGATAHLDRILSGEAPPEPILPGTVLYDALATGGFQDWSLSSEWSIVGGNLRCSLGSGWSSATVPLSGTLPGDFAVEITMRVISAENSNDKWGMILGGHDIVLDPWGDVYVDNYEINYGTNFPHVFDASPYDWHTYQFEIRGRVVSVKFEGAEFEDALVDNRWPMGGQVTIVTSTEIEVSNVRVIAL